MLEEEGGTGRRGEKGSCNQGIVNKEYILSIKGGTSNILKISGAFNCFCSDNLSQQKNLRHWSN